MCQKREQDKEEKVVLLACSTILTFRLVLGLSFPVHLWPSGCGVSPPPKPFRCARAGLSETQHRPYSKLHGSKRPKRKTEGGIKNTGIDVNSSAYAI